MKKKPESKSTGALKDEDFVPWNGITLNRCLAVAAVAALLSVGFQILQESVDIDELEEAENEVWTPSESRDHVSEPWFFEGWFGSSTQDSAIREEPEETDAVEPDVSVAEELEESELPAVDEETETERESMRQESGELEKREESKEQQKTAEQWGLKSKAKYMEAKGVKIRTAAEKGLKKEVFPFNFAKKLKVSHKPYSGEKEKTYRDGKYTKQYEEKKYDHSKKQEYEKSFKKESKYLKQDKGKKEDKDYKGYKEYHEKDYKKKYDPRHHD